MGFCIPVGVVMSTSIVFVDGRLGAALGLLQAEFGNYAEIVLLDTTQDGSNQIHDYLLGRTGLDATHILGHGASGTLFLGSSILTSDTLSPMG
jgi:hypothetical protein